ncbi:MAG: nucleotide exchange factor GrpE [Deltaproteobacteria bacterium]|nr:nucleotide exchange factor GrpE [Deltaproteobacteria bacterium]
MSKEETKIEISDKAEPEKKDLEIDGDNVCKDEIPDGTPYDESGKSDEEPDEEPGEEFGEEPNKEPDELQVARKEAKEVHDRFLRLSAEFDNYKKRVTRETKKKKKFSNETLVREILPVIDNLERAIESSGTDPEAKNGLVEGVDMTLKEMLKVFHKFNVKPIESIGESFDPSFHQAVMQEETEDHPENIVIKELQKGYIMHDRLVRPAMVIVSSAKPEDEPGAGNVASKESESCEEPAKDSEKK